MTMVRRSDRIDAPNASAAGDRPHPAEVIAAALKVDDAVLELFTDYQALGPVDREAVRKFARALARPKYPKTR